MLYAGIEPTLTKVSSIIIEQSPFTSLISKRAENNALERGIWYVSNSPWGNWTHHLDLERVISCPFRRRSHISFIFYKYYNKNFLKMQIKMGTYLNTVFPDRFALALSYSGFSLVQFSLSPPCLYIPSEDRRG